jgi:hypothetical protein
MVVWNFLVWSCHGRSPIGEFSFEDETYLSIGVYYDQ